MMTDTNILPFPGPIRPVPYPATDRSAILLEKITAALAAMREVHAELEDLKAKLKAENT
jgi:hypothetical protein